MSSPMSIPEDRTFQEPLSPDGSPRFHGLTLPSPIITRRNRSKSVSERMLEAPVQRGHVKYFSRSRGHGFITLDHGDEDIFVHISDIEGEFIPKAGDEVRFRLCPIPPKMEKAQAVHVQIIHFCPVKHQKWNYSPTKEDVKKEDEERKHAKEEDEHKNGVEKENNHH